MIKIKRVYEISSKDDGYRILVDRLWPRGLTKKKAQIHTWLKEIAPSNELRKWYAHRKERWEDFKGKYQNELVEKQQHLKEILTLEKQYATVTLIYSAKDPLHNNAVVLKESLKNISLDK